MIKITHGYQLGPSTFTIPCSPILLLTRLSYAMSDSKDLKGKAPETSNAETSNTAQESSASNPAGKIDPKLAESLLDLNPALKNELGGVGKGNAAEALRNMDIADLLTGMSVGGKNVKDMASYKFWQTQPVPRFDDSSKEVAEGPIKRIDPEKVSKEPDRLIEGFEWTTLDLNEEEQLQELWDLLTNHYVEDDNAMFRFRYSKSFLHWYVFLVLQFVGCVLIMFQGSNGPGMEERMARWCPRLQVRKASGFHLRCSNSSSRAGPKNQGHRN